MAFVFRIQRSSGRQSRKWYVRYKDPLTKRLVTRAGYEDKQATQQLAARLVRDAARHAEGMGPPPAVNRVDSLDSLRTELRQSIIDSGRTLKHATLTDQRLRDLFAWCGWRTSRELDAAAVVKALADRRRREGEKQGDKRHRIRFGLSSTNNYLRAAKQFGRWLSRRNKGFDPFIELQLMNAATDRRHKRRALSFTDLGRFLSVAAASKRPFKKLTGLDRASLYHVAAYTGLRASELHRLTIDDFTFGKTPTVYVSAWQKNRDECTMPIHRDLVLVVKQQAARRPGGPLWPGSWLQHTGVMMELDLRDAGLDYKTAAGYVDLHALRMTFNTHLKRCGVDLSDRQRLMRHSDPRLTENVYTDVVQSDLTAALAKLPTASAALSAHSPASEQG